jgi:hypothetical protein
MAESASYTLPESPTPVAEPAVEGTYVYNAAHVAEGQALLIEFFRKPRTLKALEAFLTQVQELEDVAADHRVKFDIDTAEGEQLDFLGAQVGEFRDDRTDAAYRVAINVRILVNTSQGSMNELLAILDLADPTMVVTVRETFPAGLLFQWVGGFAVLSALELMQLMQKAKAAGVKVQAVVPGTFVWGTVAQGGVANTTASWADVAQTVGGTFADVW